MSTETIRFIRDREKGGKGVSRLGGGEIIYLSLHSLRTINVILYTVSLLTSNFG